MTLHIFNPEHDLALASGLANFTAPHAGRQLRHDLGFLPVLWAKEDDLVLVDDIAVAQHALQLFKPPLCLRKSAGLVTVNRRLSDGKLPVFHHITQVAPWGWDATLRAQLLRAGLDPAMLPSDEQLQAIRNLSHRRTAAQLLSHLRFNENTVGEAVECHTIEEVQAFLDRHPRTVLKAPWSSSGRGIRFVEGIGVVEGWLRNILKAQGSVMAEPYYNKVKDFGMEFEWREGEVHYLGLSLFHTANGAYTGNILATEQAKREMLSQYLPLELIDLVKQAVVSVLSASFAEALSPLPFGIDMMVVARADGEGFLLHPCVELNLRRTMGHVALALTQLVNPENDDEVLKVMRIDYTNNQYQLKINRL